MPIIKERATVIKIEELPAWRHPLPASWLAAVGLLKKRRLDPLTYQKQVRNGWTKRLRKLGTNR